MKYRVSVDTGGTFTDVVVSDDKGTFTIGKALTTPDRIFSGMQAAISSAAAELGLTITELLTDTSLLIYGTTRATNAIVTKTVAKTAFLTTAGFPDTLLLKEGGKYRPHDFTKDYPEPFIPRRHTYEIHERINSEGEVSLPLNMVAARRTIDALKAHDYGAVAVCLLWSVLNPAHEKAVGEIIEDILPGIPYTLSHRLNPVVREYRRASATAIDASLKPLMQRHLRELEEDLRKAGYKGQILISTAGGGCSTVDALIERPIYMVGSGPAMAPIAGIAYSRLESQGEDVIVCDTGGTTFDVGIVRDGRPTFSRDTWLGPRYTGDLLGISAVDMRSIGAGGGSIAWIDDGGLMRVGPMSAGAAPGPACYGRGGTKPTVSDAAVVLGYFDPDYFLGGKMKLDVEAARTAVDEVARRVGASVEQTAFRILSLASDLMMRAIGDVTINDGVNPRESVIVAGGGAAGVNILSIARELGCSRVVVPSTASALSASGMQFADIIGEEAASLVMLSTRFDFEQVNAVLDELTQRLQAFRRDKLGQSERYRIEYFGEARYLAQVWELDTPIPGDRFRSQTDLDAYLKNFHDVHERVFAVRDEASAVETVSWKARLTVDVGRPQIGGKVIASNITLPRAALRKCYFDEAGFVPTPIYKATDLRPGHKISGPAIIEEATTTLVVNPKTGVSISGFGNYLLDSVA